MELAPAPRVGLVQIELGTGVVAGGGQVAFASHGVRGVRRGGHVRVAQPVAELGDGDGGLAGRGIQLGPHPVGAARDERGEPARVPARLPPGTLARPFGELPDDPGGLPGSGEQATRDPLGEGGPVTVQRAGDVAQPSGHGRPVLVGGGRHQGEDRPHLVDVRAHGAQPPVVLAGLVHREFGGEALPQQPGAGLLGGVVRGGRGVERGECAPRELGVRLSTYKMPCRHSRSGTGLGPGALCGQGGSNGSISAHRSSSTIHGRFPTPHERRNRRSGHARPAHLTKIVLRALRDQRVRPRATDYSPQLPSYGIVVLIIYMRT